MPTAKAVPGKLLFSPTDHTLILIDFQSQMAFATSLLIRSCCATMRRSSPIMRESRCIRLADLFLSAISSPRND